MGDRTNIEWTEATWNPVTGCTKVSHGCDHCYAETIARRFAGTPAYPNGFATTLRPERLDQPLRWRRPRRIFVCSMADLFHDDVPDEYIAQVFAVMALAPQHTFQVLTKRHGRMRSLLSSGEFIDQVQEAWEQQPGDDGPEAYAPPWPLPNVWLGVSAEDQKRADLRVPALLDTPAAVRWISAEPLLGPLDLGYCSAPEVCGAGGRCQPVAVGIDWVVVGGESGRGARPMHPDWARSLRDQCAAASVAFLFKQWGEHLPVPVEDDPQFAGGRAFARPSGGRSAAVIRDPSMHPFHSGLTRPMQPGESNGLGVMLDRDTIAVRVGKKAAGRELDGQVHDGYPASGQPPAGQR